MKSNISITNDYFTKKGKGIHMTFENGWTVSIQAGRSNYSTQMESPDGVTRASKVEIAAWDASGEWYVFKDGQEVSGHQTPDEVADFISMIKELKW